MEQSNNPIRVYADTSVFGGVFDQEFSKASKLFFEQVKNGIFQLIVSEVIHKEIIDAPDSVNKLFNEMLIYAEIIGITEESLKLRHAYLKADIVKPRWSDDALHVALATISKCRVIVSWNFRHIVHFKKIPLYNAVNIIEGYNNISIHSPLEVIDYGRKNKKF